MQETQNPGTKPLEDLVQRNFPAIDYGFAYGSGVFVQPDLYEAHHRPGAASGPMLDFIFVVADPQAWHTENLERNPSHYSFLKYLGPSTICSMADRVGVGVYFNTLVPVEGQVVKYGVVSLAAFQQDLQHWSHLYVGGRLHKPVAALTQHDAAEAARRQNLRSALTASLLLLPQACSLKDLFRRLAALSYMGDVRMGLAEDSRKVERIVAGSYEGFSQLYLPLLQEPTFQQLGVAADAEGLQQQDSHDYMVQLFSQLPSVLLARVASKLGTAVNSAAAAAAAAVQARAAASVSAELPPLPDGVRRDIGAAALAAPRYQRLIKSGLHSIVANSSRRQAVAGVLYAGPFRSLRYLGRKLAKAWPLNHSQQQDYKMQAGKVALVLAVVLAVAHAAEPQAAQPQKAAPTPFGTLNGLYQKWSGSPLAVHGFRAIQNSKGGKGLLISGAQLTASTSTSALVGPATAAHGHAKYTGLTFNKYPTFTAWIKDVASNKTSNVRMVQADAATIYVYALNATVLNPPNATNTNSVWTRVGPALPSKY
uniref:Phosphatidate cytidylyltransferase, mitochondrial n=1 Tax=Tetradesmus obliquus TaxID=3088 RepID=A0A383W2E8_TETOB|eukprot:jgi/Sobl393_1/1151/SZX71319.1